MFMTLVATFLAGIAAAGFVTLLNHFLGKTTGRSLPKWFTPVAAGAAMILATISSEYGWYSTTTENMPQEFVVVKTVESKAFYRPWTYVKPFIDSFVAVDTAKVRTHESHPGLRIADVYSYGRWAPITKDYVLADCPNGRGARLPGTVSLEGEGSFVEAPWVSIPDDDPVLTQICGG